MTKHSTVIDYIEAQPPGTGRGSVQFPNSRPIPSDLVVRMVLKRLEMLASVEGNGKGKC